MKKLSEAEIREMVDKIYKAYGSHYGVLFGIPPEHKDAIVAVIQAFLRLEGRW